MLLDARCRSRRRFRSNRCSAARRTSAGRCGCTLAGVLPRERLGEFALRPQQAEVRAVFAPLARIQRDLGVPGQVNTDPRSPAPATARRRAAVAAASWRTSASRVDRSPSRATDGHRRAARAASSASRSRSRRVARPSARRSTFPSSPIWRTPSARAIARFRIRSITATDLVDPLGRLGGARRRRRRSAAELTPIAHRAERVGGARAWRRRSAIAIDVDYYLWDRGAGLHDAAPRRSPSTAIVPIAGLRRRPPPRARVSRHHRGGEPRPTGIRRFPIDLSRVRPSDEEYWTSTGRRRRRSSPTSAGRDLWRSRYGARRRCVCCSTRRDAAERARRRPARAAIAALPADAMGVTHHAGARRGARRRRRARPTSASTSPTSASSSSSRRCCWPCCSSSSASSSGCGRSASCARRASRWRPSGGCC